MHLVCTYASGFLLAKFLVENAADVNTKKTPTRRLHYILHVAWETKKLLLGGVWCVAHLVSSLMKMDGE